MRRVAVVGAGKIGGVAAELLATTGAYQVRVLDRDPATLQCLPRLAGLQPLRTAITDPEALAAALGGCEAVVNCAPFHLTTCVAQAARAAGCHYLDLTEDVAASRRVRELAQDAPAAFIPQCGLAPGFITIAAWDLAGRFDVLHDMRLRVGALPRYPSNALNYNLTWSTDGVINEYCEPCEDICGGRLREVPALEGCEEFALDGVAYEAFNTSGGLGTLAQTLMGRVQTLNYKTIRYPGHAQIMRALLDDLGLRNRRALLKDILENSVPATLQDVVLVFVTASGLRGGTLVQETRVNRIFAQPVGGRLRSAIQVTTASSVCAVLDLLLEGAIPRRGFVRQEDIPLDAFLDNRFGRVFAADAALAGAA